MRRGWLFVLALLMSAGVCAAERYRVQQVPVPGHPTAVMAVAGGVVTATTEDLGLVLVDTSGRVVDVEPLERPAQNLLYDRTHRQLFVTFVGGLARYRVEPEGLELELEDFEITHDGGIVPRWPRAGRSCRPAERH